MTGAAGAGPSEAKRHLFAWLSVAAILVSTPPDLAWSHPPPAREVTETKDRLTFDDLEALVAEPLRLARGGDLPAARAAFETLLEQRRREYGENSPEVADTLAAFMLLLYEEEYGREALEYASQSIDAVRRAWGSDHPEYALILNDAVQLDYKLNGDSVSLQAEAALLEVYRIRAARMGETHKETIATLIYLGRIQGLHSRTGGTLAGAAPAIATLQKAVALTDRWRPPGLNDNVWARQVLAETFARNGALQPAMQTFAKAIEVGVAQDAPDAVSAEDFIDAL